MSCVAWESEDHVNSFSSTLPHKQSNYSHPNSCIPPNTSGMEYTSPAIRLPDGTYIMDSFAIAQKLESLHPTPSLHLDSPYQSRIEEFLPTMVNQVRPIFMPLVPQKFLNPRSKEYFISTREKALGMPLEQYAKNAKQGFTNVKPYAKELGDMYAENDGPFLMGKEVCYADIMVLGWLRMFDRLGEVSKIFEMEGGEKLKDVYQTTGKWFERDTY